VDSQGIGPLSDGRRRRDLTDPVQEVRTRSAAGQMHTSDVLQTDPPPVVTLYELIE
jgi:hypothetical protein